MVKIRNERDGKPVTKGDHLRREVDEKVIPILTDLIQKMNRGKDLEKFLAEVFKRIPGVKVIPNCFGWGTDHGADLKLIVRDFLGVEKLVVVQVKSYEGKTGTGVIKDHRKSL